MAKFFELTAGEEEVGVVNAEQVVNITKLPDGGIGITLTTGQNLYSDMSYEKVKNILLDKKPFKVRVGNQ